jgi:hypothetical protein
LLLEANKP